MKPRTIPLMICLFLALTFAVGTVAAQTPPALASDVDPLGGVPAANATPVLNSSHLAPDLPGEAEANLTDLRLEAAIRERIGLGEDPGHAASSKSISPKAEGAMPAIVAAGTVAAAGLVFSFWHLVRLLLGAATFSPLFSRTEGKQVLENATRNQIHQAISENPGLCLRDLQGLVGVGWGTIVYHVARLESATLIVSRRHRQYRRFYKNGSGIPESGRTAAAELTNDTSKRLAVAVARKPGQIQRDLCERVGVRPPVAHKYLARLEQAQLLTRERSDGTVRYYPTQELRTLVHGETLPSQPRADVQFVTA